MNKAQKIAALEVENWNLKHPVCGSRETQTRQRPDQDHEDALRGVHLRRRISGYYLLERAEAL